MTDAGQGLRAITVKAVTAPNTVQVASYPLRLAGWSLVSGDVAGLSNAGSVTSPAAGATIVSLSSVPAGDYLLSWQVDLAGTVAAGDTDNFQLFSNAVLVATSLNPGAVGQWQQNAQEIVIPAGGANVAIRANAIGTVGAIYSAQLTLATLGSAQGQIMDGAQVLGVTAPPGGQSDTQWLSDEGVYCSGPISVQALQGTLSGVLYAADLNAHEKGHKWQQRMSTSLP